MNILFILLFCLLIPMYIVILYHFVVSFFGYIKKGNNKLSSFQNDSPLKLAVVIAAHNEENVIENTILSIKNSDYDKNLYEIFVVADNCSDKTAELVRKCGVNLLERNDDSRRGKGYALAYAFLKIPDEFDAYVIIDADNTVKKDFLSEISKPVVFGYSAAQGYIMAKNPYDSWVSASYHITHLVLNTLYQEARFKLGLPVQLNGTGLCFSKALLKEISWNPDCLTEDIEMTVKTVILNKKIAYNKNAVVYDEKPVDIVTSLKQRTRWMQGQTDVLYRYIIPLIKNMINGLFLDSFDILIYLIQPFFFSFSGITAVISLILAFVPKYLPLFKTPFGIVISVVQFISLPLFLMVERKLTKKELKYYIPYLIFMYTWIPVSITGIINRKKKIWFHTKHSLYKAN